jgi:pyruvate/2-oxoglutarate dehydrogenase complex dihydrolipoamide acyltransferase (E2) component
MATSADKLAIIIETLSKKYKFSNDNAIKFLSEEELLPKKLLPKETKGENVWASKKAQELAEAHDIEPKGNGSGKNGKWTLADVEKAMEKPSKQKLLVSPNALNLANEHKISLVGMKGSGKDGRIVLEDVKKMITKKEDSDEDDLNITPRALQHAQELGITQEELENLHGSGKEGRILIDDIKKYKSSSDEEAKSDHSEDDNDDEED